MFEETEIKLAEEIVYIISFTNAKVKGHTSNVPECFSTLFIIQYKRPSHQSYYGIIRCILCNDISSMSSLSSQKAPSFKTIPFKFSHVSAVVTRLKKTCHIIDGFQSHLELVMTTIKALQHDPLVFFL